MDFSILSNFSEEELTELMNLGMKYQNLGSYAEPVGINQPTYDPNLAVRNLCGDGASYSKPNTTAVSWASAIIIAAETALRNAECEDKLSLSYVLDCLPKLNDVKPNDVSPSDILRFVSEDGLISESAARAAALMGEKDICSASSLAKYRFETEYSTVPNESGLKNFMAEGNPVIVLLALNLVRLRSASNVTGEGVYTGATDNPSLYAVMKGYNEEKWNVTFNVVPCENMVLQLPITESDTNANYAGIAGFASSLKALSLSPPSTTQVDTEITLQSGGTGVNVGINYGYGDLELFSMTVGGSEASTLSTSIPNHLVNIALKDQDTTWDDVMPFSITTADGTSVTIPTTDMTTSDPIFFHPLYGTIPVTSVSSCQAFFEALKTDKIVHLEPNSCNDPSVTELLIGESDSVVYLWIENDNFLYVNKFEISDNANLEFINIAENSFTQDKGTVSDDGSRRLGDVSKSFMIKDCVKLISIEMGQYSFSDFAGEFGLIRLPSLQTIDIGKIGSESKNFFSNSFSVQCKSVFSC